MMENQEQNTQINEQVLDENNKEDISWIQNMGHLHFWGNILGWWIIGLLLVIFYNQQRKNGFITEREDSTYREIVNFNLTYIMLIWISCALIFLAIWIFLLPIVLIAYIITLISWYISHLNWRIHKYLWSIQFIKWPRDV